MRLIVYVFLIEIKLSRGLFMRNNKIMEEKITTKDFGLSFNFHFNTI